MVSFGAYFSTAQRMISCGVAVSSWRLCAASSASNSPVAATGTAGCCAVTTGKGAVATLLGIVMGLVNPMAMGRLAESYLCY
jgi:hypothetical protein